VKLVQNWTTAWRWLSVQLAIIAAAGQLIMATLPQIRDWVSDDVQHYIGAAIITSIVLGRLIDQKKPEV
jgi:hypothetical protein